MGYRPGEWEDLQPVELYAVQDAWCWRRSRDMELLAIGVAWLRSLLTATDPVDILDSLPGYRKDQE